MDAWRRDEKCGGREGKETAQIREAENVHGHVGGCVKNVDFILFFKKPQKVFYFFKKGAKIPEIQIHACGTCSCTHFALIASSMRQQP